MVYPSTMARRQREQSIPGAEEPLLQSDPWSQYLHSLMEPSGPLSAPRVREIERLWECLRGQMAASLTLPYATATETGQFVMTWDRGPRHFEIEILPDGRYDWFYLDRSSGERAGEEEHPVGTCSPRMIAHLRRAIA
jgi:hypothetical protein